MLPLLSIFANAEEAERFGVHLVVVATLLAFATYTGLGHYCFRKRPWFWLGVQLVVALIPAMLLWSINHFKSAGEDLEEGNALLTAVIIFVAWIFLLTLVFRALPSRFQKRQARRVGEHQNN